MTSAGHTVPRTFPAYFGVIEVTDMVTETQIPYLMLGMVARKLATEINTGLSGRRITVGDQYLTPMDAARAICGTPKRTKRGVLCDYVAWWTPIFREAFGCEWDMGESVKRAMLKPAK